MSEKMTPLPFGELLERLLTEYERQGTVFGERRFYKAGGKALPIFGEKLETPIGPAAGPHTQMAQNIVTAYCCGARFFELKTVQKMDGAELAACISRPCIKADYEGYNCEWSTELTVPQAFAEYVKAWVACKIVSRLWGLGQSDGFVFNMSVGYDLAGIKTPKLDAFINGMKDASATPEFRECLDIAAARLPEMADFIRGIDPHICRSVTVSTLHGCPPQEIESIAAYLIEEKGLNTFVKCNPTLLGYDFVRQRLDQAGFGYIAFDDHHYKTDLQWADAAPMFRRLQALAESKGLEFGLKLSNTCPVDVKAGELPSDEMYMSGRSLYLLTVEMARRIAAEFRGRLRLSFSGGIDYFNVKPLFEAGVWPITVATTLLQPGGYGRLHQMAKLLESCDFAPFSGVDAAAVARLSEEAPALPRHRHPAKSLDLGKGDTPSPLIDCYTAPCREACPIGQDAPEYLELLRQGKDAEALRLILAKNPLPFTTGTICAHRCMERCTRRFMDAAVDIRGAKLKAAEAAYEQVLPTLTPPALDGPKCAVVGAGPAGLAAAYFLGRAGCPVTLFEKEEHPGGVPRYVIPGFRISEEAIDKDIAIALSMGGEYLTGAPAPDGAELKRRGYAYVLLACGADRPVKLEIPGKVIQALDYLAADKAGSGPALGKSVAVIGGGNTAMDAARAARRAEGVERVSIVYRRTKAQMPAAEEELELALSEGVEFRELLNPISQADGSLLCRVMELGEPDASGRRRPVETEKTVTLPADTVIAALGAAADPAVAAAYNESFDADHLFTLGDAKRGPATVVEAIADALEAAAAISGSAHAYSIPGAAYLPAGEARKRKCELGAAGGEDCLACDSVCENCVSVCPNRANAVIETPIGPQVLHLDRLCNECGNCASFCPYAGGPYRDKFTLFGSAEDFNDSENQGFLPLDKQQPIVRLRLDGEICDLDLTGDDAELDSGLAELVRAVYRDYSYLL